MSEEKGGNNIIIIVLAIFISVLLASGASYFIFTKFAVGANNNRAQVDSTSKELGTTTPIGQFLVNLADGRRFIKVNIVLEVSNDKVVTELTERQPQVRDAIITILRAKDNNQINSNEGVRKLRTEIMNKINQNLIKGKVTNVFFTDFVVQ
ncbi:flagellar FliL protein [Orenia metallireducens]|uniref:Flagellar protein FliL n=1 Tax=Orenia metallireducens TaxID=1413210 RepID=A0A285FPN9_9FIRM|nr:flagellar basal body-associated FliL family protein [Orenia metallireducens]PRX33665.1 flagellar FliL protein [Orenia metallireducens]SNY13053.1 flagellar FliL protein [Orenia metallireducens]